MQLHIFLFKIIINILIVVEKCYSHAALQKFYAFLMIYIFFSLSLPAPPHFRKKKFLIKLMQFMSSVWEEEKNELFKYLNCNGMLKFLFNCVKREEVQSCYLAKLFFYKHFSQNAALLWNKNKSLQKCIWDVPLQLIVAINNDFLKMSWHTNFFNFLYKLWNPMTYSAIFQNLKKKLMSMSWVPYPVKITVFI